MIFDTKITLQAVPKIIKAIGAVAQSGEGAKLLPASVPAKCINGSVDPAIALLRLSIQAFLNTLEKMMPILLLQFQLNKELIHQLFPSVS